MRPINGSLILLIVDSLRDFWFIFISDIILWLGFDKAFQALVLFFDENYLYVLSFLFINGNIVLSKVFYPLLVIITVESGLPGTSLHILRYRLRLKSGVNLTSFKLLNSLVSILDFRLGKSGLSMGLICWYRVGFQYTGNRFLHDVI